MAAHCFSFFWFVICNLPSDDDDIYHEDNLEYDSGFGNIIVVDNLPVVAREKFDKLEGVIRKIYSQIGVIKEDGLWMPVDPETQKTLGYCFIEYNTPQVLTPFSSLPFFSLTDVYQNSSFNSPSLFLLLMLHLNIVSMYLYLYMHIYTFSFI